MINGNPIDRFLLVWLLAVRFPFHLPWKMTVMCVEKLGLSHRFGLSSTVGGQLGAFESFKLNYLLFVERNYEPGKKIVNEH